MNKIINNFRYLFGLPKSIYINFRLLPLKDALFLPIIVSSKTKLSSLKGKAVISKKKIGVVRIGFGSIKLLDYSYNRTILHIDGTIIFDGKCKIGQGSRVEIGKEGVLKCGHNFIASGQTKIICYKNIDIGKDTLFAWESLVMDSDYHKIYDSNSSIINRDKKIVIGDKVWVGARTTLLKGTNIADGCVVASNSLISKVYSEKNCILAGVPAKIVKRDVSWSE